MRHQRGLRRLLVIAGFLLVAALVGPQSAQAQDAQGFLLSILDAAAGQSGVPTRAEIEGSIQFITCLAGPPQGQDEIWCYETYGTALANNPYIDTIVSLYRALQADSFWTVVSICVQWFYEDAVCIVASIILPGGGSALCSVVKALIEFAESIWALGEAFINFLADVGEALYCGTLGWIFGGCDDDSVPPAVFCYRLFFEKRLGEGVTALEASDEQYGAVVAAAVAEANTFEMLNEPFCQGEPNQQAQAVFRAAVEGLWTPDILNRVMPVLEAERAAYRTPETDAMLSQVALDACLTRDDPYAAKPRCLSDLAASPTEALLQRWLTYPTNPPGAHNPMKYHIVTADKWCQDYYGDLRQHVWPAYYAERTQKNCPQTEGKAMCWTAADYEACSSAGDCLSQFGICRDGYSELAEKCPNDGYGHRNCTTYSNYEYCQAHIGDSNHYGHAQDQCVLGEVQELANRCPVDEYHKRVCSSVENYGYCTLVIDHVNTALDAQDSCGWRKEVADGEAGRVDQYFKDHQSQYPCAIQPAASHSLPAYFRCGRPRQRHVCLEQARTPMVSCSSQNDAAYEAVAGQVVAEVAAINAKRSQPGSHGIHLTDPRLPDQTLRVDAIDAFAVLTGSPKRCTSLEAEASIPAAPFPAPSRNPRFDFNCSNARVVDPATVDGYASPTIIWHVPPIPQEDLVTTAPVDPALRNIRAGGQQEVVGPGPIEELANVQNRIRDGERLNVDVENRLHDGERVGVDVQLADTQRVTNLNPGAASAAKVAGRLTPGQAVAVQPEEEIGRVGRAGLAGGAVLTGAGQVAEPAQMTPMMGSAPAGATPSGAPGGARALPPPPGGPAAKADLSADAPMVIGNKTANWGAALMLDAKDALRAANGTCLFTLRYTARNTGPAPAAAFSSTLSSSAAPTGSERLWPGLAPAGSSTQSDVVTLKPGLNALTLWLDQKGEVPESNEANNQTRLQVNLTGPCDAPTRVAVRPGVGSTPVPVNPVTGLPAVRPPTPPPGAPTPRPTPAPVPVGTTVPGTRTPPGLPVTPTPTPVPTGPGPRIETPGIPPLGLMSVDLVVVPQLTLGGRAAEWGRAISVDARDAQRADGGVCSFPAQYSVRNGGPARSGGFESALSTGARGALPNVKWSELSAGAQGTRTDLLELKPGTNVLTLTLDPAQQVQEANETNNEVRLQVTVTGTCLAAGIPIKAPLAPKALATPAPPKKK